MNLKEFIDKEVKTTINGMISESRPIPMDTPNEFTYIDFKKYAYKNRKMFKKELQKSNGNSGKMFLTLSALWYKWAKQNHKEFTHIKDSKKFGRALMVMMVKDDLIFSIDAFRKTNNITTLKEDEYVDQAFNDAKPVEESVMSELDLLAKEAKDLKSFIKTAYKEFDNLPKSKDTLNWLKDTYTSATTDEGIEEAAKRDYKKEYEKYGKSEKAKKYRAELNKYNRQKGTYGNGDGKDASHKGGKIVGFEDESKNRGRAEKSRLKKESVNEEQIDEKLITFSNRAPYGQIVFMAGGAGSGKGYAIDNFIDSAGFKVRDVDEMKKAVGKLDQLGKFSVDKWYKKYGKKLSDKPGKSGGLSPKAHIEEFVLGKGLSISDISKDLKNPNNVASLHYIVDSMGLKDKWLISMLSGKDNKETLPNLLFDITAKKVSSITDVITPLIANGYDAKNIHLIWVLSNFHVAIKANKDRDRMVPEDILLQTHEGAGKTMWEVMTKILPKGLNGRIDVILNKRAETVPYVDSKGNEIKVEPNQMNKLKAARTVVKGFKSLPIKKQGGGIQPEKAWKMLLKSWILDNAPKTIDLSQQVDEGKNDYFKTAGEAVEFAKNAAEKKGFDIDEDDWNSQITMGGKYNRLRPGVGKTHSFQIGLLKKGKPQRKGLSISLYGMDSGKYELTHYIN
jgi:hypothetical protein